MRQSIIREPIKHDGDQTATCCGAYLPSRGGMLSSACALSRRCSPCVCPRVTWLVLCRNRCKVTFGLRGRVAHASARMPSPRCSRRFLWLLGQSINQSLRQPLHQRWQSSVNRRARPPPRRAYADAHTSSVSCPTQAARSTPAALDSVTCCSQAFAMVSD